MTRQTLQVQRNAHGDVLRMPVPETKKAAKKAKKIDDRMQLQIRVGAKLIENLDAAVAWRNYLHTSTDESRTSLGTRAIESRLSDPDWQPGRTTADVLVGQRKPLLIRVERDLMARIDVACAAATVTRTVWVLDAFLAELATVKAEATEATEEDATEDIEEDATKDIEEDATEDIEEDATEEVA